MAEVLSLPGGSFVRRSHELSEGDLKVWDQGVFLNELRQQKMFLDPKGPSLSAREPLSKGTFKGTQLALTQVYAFLEEATVSHLDSTGLESFLPVAMSLDEKQKIFQWSDGTDGYPPHVAQVKPDPKIFNQGKQLEIIQKLPRIYNLLIPNQISVDSGLPFKGPTIKDVEEYNNDPVRKVDNDTDIMHGKNLGQLSDWFSDARFAQQHFSGVNPTTIETVKPEILETYVTEAERQGLQEMRQILADGKDILIEDYSYFREATGMKDDETFQNVVTFVPDSGPPEKSFRYACASVVVFKLHEDGRLHPLAITLDYRGSLEKSITIFNRRLNPDSEEVDEKNDWPWRYAKTCAQTADWARHEIAVHLTDTHMIEEAIIVATQRMIPEDHLLWSLVRPHWFRTLALNQSARLLMVPYCVAPIAGFGPFYDPKNIGANRVFNFVRYSYKKFDFQAKYIPTDLKNRGFDLEGEMGVKYRNYPYATLMFYLWGFIHDFAEGMLATQYKSDEDVKNDRYIAAWCEEIHTKAQIPSFPTITTFAQLVDALTMIIHIATTQHTAVNYLQEYYYDFVISKPPALITPLPKDLETLQSYTEAELTAALPIGVKNGVWKDWLLASLLPQLLSYKVDPQYNLVNYAKCLYLVNLDRTDEEKQNTASESIRDIAKKFYDNLEDMKLLVEAVEANQTEGTVPYPVLQPELTAVSILI